MLALKRSSFLYPPHSRSPLLSMHAVVGGTIIDSFGHRGRGHALQPLPRPHEVVSRTWSTSSTMRLDTAACEPSSCCCDMIHIICLRFVKGREQPSEWRRSLPQGCYITTEKAGSNSKTDSGLDRSEGDDGSLLSRSEPVIVYRWSKETCILNHQTT